MNKTFEEWVEAYNKKVPEGFKRDERFALFYLPDKGFCEITAVDNMVIVRQVSGDGRFWHDFANKLARKLDIKVGGTVFGRKAFRAYAKLLGFKIDKVDEKNGLKRYYCTGKNGEWGIMTEFLCEGGRKQCYVTWGVKEDEV